MSGTAFDFFAGKRVAVTGAGGSVGGHLVRKLLERPVAEVRALDNNENALFFLNHALEHEARLQTFVCDVRSECKVRYFLKDIDLIFHCAALKHVPLSERSPFETVQTNVTGVQNVIQAAMYNGVEKVLFTSSDKAVNPTNVMGTTKLMGERLMTAANALRNGHDGAVFSSTRFGNVAGSAGSVIPLFCQQIAKGGPVTLTDARMTRFVMTLDDAVEMVIRSIQMACGGEVFIVKMPVLRIKDLAEVMIDLLAPIYGRAPGAIEITEVGARTGEKEFEELSTSEETRRLLDLEGLFAVLPAFRNIYDGIAYEYDGIEPKRATKAYNSAHEPAMTRAEVMDLLHQPMVLPEEVRVHLPARVRVA